MTTKSQVGAAKELLIDALAALDNLDHTDTRRVEAVLADLRSAAKILNDFYPEGCGPFPIARKLKK